MLRSLARIAGSRAGGIHASPRARAPGAGPGRRRSRSGRRLPRRPHLQGRRHHRLRPGGRAQAVPAARVLGQPRLLLLRGHAARDRADHARLHRPARLQRRQREVQGPREDRARGEHGGLRRRPALRRQDRLQGRSAGRRQGDVELRLALARRRHQLPVLLLVLGPRRGAAALLRGHRQDHQAGRPRGARVRGEPGRPVPRREAQAHLRHRGGRALRRARHPA